MSIVYELLQKTTAAGVCMPVSTALKKFSFAFALVLLVYVQPWCVQRSFQSRPTL